MKLKRHFTFEERRPYLADHVFYVPQYYNAYEDYVFPPFATLFKNAHPVCVEYCSGNGDWILEKAQAHPEMNWIAVEKRFDRVQKIWSKMTRRSIDNLLIVCGEAFAFTHYYLPNASLEEVYINFPDPWLKMRHVKHRLIQLPFLDELTRVLEPKKRVTFVTDEFGYLQETLSHFCRHPFFAPFFPEPYFTTELHSYGTSWFEDLWREKGKQIYYTQFVNTQLCKSRSISPVLSSSCC